MRIILAGNLLIAHAILETKDRNVFHHGVQVTHCLLCILSLYTKKDHIIRSEIYLVWRGNSQQPDDVSPGRSDNPKPMFTDRIHITGMANKHYRCARKRQLTT